MKITSPAKFFIPLLAAALMFGAVSFAHAALIIGMSVVPPEPGTPGEPCTIVISYDDGMSAGYTGGFTADGYCMNDTCRQGEDDTEGDVVAGNGGGAPGTVDTGGRCVGPQIWKNGSGTGADAAAPYNGAMNQVFSVFYQFFPDAAPAPVSQNQ